MKGRNFITVIGIAVMLVSVNAMADDTPAPAPTTKIISDGGNNYLGLPITTKGGITIDFGDMTLSPNGGKGGSNNKVAMVNCVHPASSAVQILDKFVKPVVLANYATKVYRDQIASNTTIATTYITNKAQTDQLFWNGVLSNPMAPYILSVMYGGNGGGNSLYGNNGMYAGGLYGSSGNISFASLGAAANHARY